MLFILLNRISFAIKPVLAAIGAVNVEQDVQKFIKKYTTDTKPPTLSASSDLGYPPMTHCV